MDYTLRFPDKATADALLFDAEGVSKYPSHTIDVIGTIYKPTGTIVTGEDGEYPEVAPVAGWHVNARGEQDPTLDAYQIEVQSPVRVWL